MHPKHCNLHGQKRIADPLGLFRMLTPLKYVPENGTLLFTLAGRWPAAHIQP